MFHACTIANHFIARAEERGDPPLSVLALVRLVYLAHGWHLEMRGTSLIRNAIEAWRKGPMVLDLYRAFRPQGVYAERPVSGFPLITGLGYQSFLDQIYDLYGKSGPFVLAELTQTVNGPWDKAIKTDGLFARIPNSSIRAHHVTLRENQMRTAWTSS